jgi:hypothetical protein
MENGLDMGTLTAPLRAESDEPVQDRYLRSGISNEAPPAIF